MGFIVATWIGFMLGVVEAWSKKVLLGIFFILGTLIVVSTFAQGTTEAASSINWAVLIGTIPGYLLGFPAGNAAYERATEEA